MKPDFPIILIRNSTRIQSWTAAHFFAEWQHRAFNDDCAIRVNGLQKGRIFELQNHLSLEDCSCSFGISYRKGRRMMNEEIMENEQNKEFLFIFRKQQPRILEMTVEQHYEFQQKMKAAIRKMRMIEFSGDILFRERMKDLSKIERDKLRELDKQYEPKLVVDNTTSEKKASAKDEISAIMVRTGLDEKKAKVLHGLIKNLGVTEEKARAVMRF